MLSFSWYVTHDRLNAITVSWHFDACTIQFCAISNIRARLEHADDLFSSELVSHKQNYTVKLMSVFLVHWQKQASGNASRLCVDRGKFIAKFSERFWIETFAIDIIIILVCMWMSFFNYKRKKNSLIELFKHECNMTETSCREML